MKKQHFTHKISKYLSYIISLKMFVKSFKSDKFNIKI